MSDARLIAALAALMEARFGEPCERHETHISWVLACGDVALKIKKPVDLGFLDFSTLERRRRMCEREVELNRRLAPTLYLGVVPITGSPEAPAIGGPGEPIEYAVRMRRFPSDALLEALVAGDRVPKAAWDRFVEELARFHAEAPVAPAGSDWGTPACVRRQMLDNLEVLAAAGLEGAAADALAAVQAWTREELERRAAAIAARRAGGRVRACHGDLHLGNLVWLDGRITAFDCIEFSDALRFIDCLSELAFLVMDLGAHGRLDLARRVRSRYLEATGDYEGAGLVRLYAVYRAAVRAKVAALGGGARAGAVAHYLKVARGLAEPGPAPRLVLMHGLSGSGKSVLAEALVERLPGALRLRSDVERKRLAGLDPQARSGSAVGEGLYTPEMTGRTYARLAALAERLLAEGFTVVVDATFGTRARRAPFVALARRLGVAAVAVTASAPDAVLEARVRARAEAGGDASEADLGVLAAQRAHFEPVAADEGLAVVAVDTGAGVDADAVARRVAAAGGCDGAPQKNDRFDPDQPSAAARRAGTD